jgi:twitching motility protein PilT
MAYEMDKLLDFIVEKKGSDLILTVGSPPTVRLHGTLKPISNKPLEPEDTLSLIKQIVPERNKEEFETLGSTDFSLRYSTKATFRGAAFRQQGHMALVMRLIPNELIPFEVMNLPKALLEQAMRPRGLFLVTGPTGSGKSSTIATLINHVNLNSHKHILTVEDPIEYYHSSANCVINQRAIGEDAPSFGEALKRALRQDPDLILVGEMRDLETIETALRAAETGHLVLSTLHTRSAAETISRIVDAFPAVQQEMVRTQLASSLNVVVCQTLVKKVDGGRTLASEIMVVNHGMRQMIRDNRIHQIPSALETSAGEGNRLLDNHLCDLYLRGEIKWADAMDRAIDATSIKARLTEVRNSLPYWISQIDQKRISVEEAMKSCPDPKGLRATLQNRAKKEQA